MGRAHPTGLDALIRDVLTNPASLVYKPGSRYRVVAPDQRIVVLVDEKGIPVSLIFQPDTSTYGAPLCTIQDLLD